MASEKSESNIKNKETSNVNTNKESPAMEKLPSPSSDRKSNMKGNVQDSKPAPDENSNLLDGKLENEKKDRIFTSKDIILEFINFVTIILLVVFLIKLPEKASSLKNLKIDQLKSESASLLPEVEMKNAGTKADEIEGLFLDQSGIVDFVDEVEKLKVEGSTIQKVSFASQKPVKDKTGFSGVPVVIELRGSWEAIAIDLQRIESLSYLFRTASVDAVTIPDNPGVIDFKYGGFLYVSDELGKN